MIKELSNQLLIDLIKARVDHDTAHKEGETFSKEKKQFGDKMESSKGIPDDVYQQEMDKLAVRHQSSKKSYDSFQQQLDKVKQTLQKVQEERKANKFPLPSAIEVEATLFTLISTVEDQQSDLDANSTKAENVAELWQLLEKKKEANTELRRNLENLLSKLDTVTKERDAALKKLEEGSSSYAENHKNRKRARTPSPAKPNKAARAKARAALEANLTRREEMVVNKCKKEGRKASDNVLGKLVKAARDHVASGAQEPKFMKSAGVDDIKFNSAQVFKRPKSNSQIGDIPFDKKYFRLHRSERYWAYVDDDNRVQRVYKQPEHHRDRLVQADSGSQAPTFAAPSPAAAAASSEEQKAKDDRHLNRVFVKSLGPTQHVQVHIPLDAQLYVLNYSKNYGEKDMHAAFHGTLVASECRNINPKELGLEMWSFIKFCNDAPPQDEGKKKKD